MGHAPSVSSATSVHAVQPTHADTTAHGHRYVHSTYAHIHGAHAVAVSEPRMSITRYRYALPLSDGSTRPTCVRSPMDVTVARQSARTEASDGGKRAKITGEIGRRNRWAANFPSGR